MSANNTGKLGSVEIRVQNHIYQNSNPHKTFEMKRKTGSYLSRLATVNSEQESKGHFHWNASYGLRLQVTVQCQCPIVQMFPFTPNDLFLRSTMRLLKIPKTISRIFMYYITRIAPISSRTKHHSEAHCKAEFQRLLSTIAYFNELTHIASAYKTPHSLML